MVPHERLSAAADPVKVMSSCRPILVISLGATLVRLGEGKLKSEHEHNLHGLVPSALCRAGP